MLASVWTGLMDSVQEKLSSLMVDESTKFLGVHKQVQFMSRELSTMRAALEDVADMENTDSRTRAWRNEVMELAYEIEDCIDDFRHRVEGPHDGQGLMRKAVHLLETMMARYQIYRNITELRTRVQEASDRHARYMLDECVSRSALVSVDPRITSLYVETSTLVGIDDPKKEVIKLLTEVDDASLQDLRVVSIVGFGGLGKTTLANEVYRNISDCFTCKAIISVSQRPDMLNLLMSLFSKVSGQRENDTYDLQGLIDNLREYLQGKRYLIIVDDLWDALAWEIIKCAFPESRCGSRVLTTTRIENVAKASCSGQWKFVYRMKPLSNDHSGQLFHRRIFGLGDKCPEAFEGLCEKILQKCGGLPLAIITIASLLASQPTRSIEHWKYVLNSLRHNMGLDPTLEGMRQILNLSYAHLPHHLKACLLYIGMYPEDHDINRDNLVFQFIAEGFIAGLDGTEAVEVAGSYLNQLVNSSMIIQRVEYKLGLEHISYRVHDMVLDLILSKSTEENFLGAVQNLQEISTTQQQYRARRLSLQFEGRSSIESATRVSMSHVRSLAIFGRCLHSMLGLLELKFLRVLYIQEAGNDLNATVVSKLFHLRYFCIHCSYKGLQLPNKISGLRNLKVLIILGYAIGALPDVPQDIFYLQALLHLRFHRDTVYPDGIGNLKCLHTLRDFDVSRQSVANIWALGELLNLRVLQLWIHDASFVTKATHVDALRSSLEKLISGCNLKVLSIHEWAWVTNRRVVDVDHDMWGSLDFSRSHLEELRLYGYCVWLPSMLAWVSQLRALRNLEIRVIELCEDDVAVLARLPALARLVLGFKCVPRPSRGVIFSAHATFNVLRYLDILKCLPCGGVTFEAGSMPLLDTLKFRLLVDDMKEYGVKLAGMEHLPSLKHVHVGLLCKEESERSVIEAQIQSAFDAHPAGSNIRIKFG